MKKFWNKALKVIWVMLGFIYFPVYVVAWLLHKLARLLLAIAYIFMFKGRQALTIIINLFRIY